METPIQTELASTAAFTGNGKIINGSRLGIEAQSTRAAAIVSNTGKPGKRLIHEVFGQAQGEIRKRSNDIGDQQFEGRFGKYPVVRNLAHFIELVSLAGTLGRESRIQIVIGSHLA